MEGFYAVYYTGVAGLGHAVLVINEKIVTGADVAGGVYNGSYSITEKGEFNVEINFTIPAGTTLVTGQTLPEEFTQTITTKLNSNFANGQPVPVNTQLGPVNAVFKKLRDLP